MEQGGQLVFNTSDRVRVGRLYGETLLDLRQRSSLC
jgi:hypothetical protein